MTTTMTQSMYFLYHILLLLPYYYYYYYYHYYYYSYAMTIKLNHTILKHSSLPFARAVPHSPIL